MSTGGAPNSGQREEWKAGVVEESVAGQPRLYRMRGAESRHRGAWFILTMWANMETFMEL